MMSTSLSVNLQPIWMRFKEAYRLKRLPKALLLMQPGLTCVDLVQHMQALLLCQSDSAPCGVCQSCQLLDEGIHPDLEIVSPPGEQQLVKIESIRAVQDRLYLTPQLSKRRVIYFEALDRMTVSASSALLKILEEPPKSVYFIGMAQAMHSILPTILSRFQRWMLPEEWVASSNYLDPLRWGTKEHAFIELLQAWPTHVNDLLQLKQGKVSAYLLAEKWVNYPLATWMSVLYCLFGQMLQLRFASPNQLHFISEKLAIEHPQGFNELTLLNQTFPISSLFYLLERLEEIMKKLDAHISIQPILTLENWLSELNRSPY